MTQPRRVRVLIVDDSAVQRQLLSCLLGRDPELDVVGSASNGVDALRAVSELQPDLVTLDECMPGIDGLETARRIMHQAPTPIVMVSSLRGQHARELSAAAAAVGVLAVQDKRALSGTDPAATAELLRVIKSMAAVRLVRRRREPSATPLLNGPPQAPRAPVPPLVAGPVDVVAIGASTGGPQALREILTRLPADFSVPVLVVQHTTAGYSHTLVDWLQLGTRLRVCIAEDGQPFSRPGVYVAPTERHLVVRGRHLALLDEPPCSLHRPSATVLFRSVAAAYGARAVGILLTGMGDDGAAGLLEMKRSGGFTIAQDEASSVVFGMPAEAIRLGAASRVLAPRDMPRLLLELLGRREVGAA